MRLHSDIITADDVRTAATFDGVGVHRLTEHGSRIRLRGLDVVLTGHGLRGGQFGSLGNARSASWDDYGIFLAALYAIDSDMVVGTSAKRPTYSDRHHFEQVTHGRFRALRIGSEGIHHNHRWKYDSPHFFICKGMKDRPCHAELDQTETPPAATPSRLRRSLPLLDTTDAARVRQMLAAR